jgi:hypothetical protein
MMSVILEELVEMRAGGFIWDHHDHVTGKDTIGIHYKIFVPFLKVDWKEADLACAKLEAAAANQWL